MQAKRIIAVPLVCALLAPAVFAAGCGGGEDESTPTAGAGSNGETTGAAGTTEDSGGGEPEPGDDKGGNAPAPSGDAVRAETVEIDDFAYEPDPVTIEEGGKVIWINQDSAPHTATADDGSFDTGTIEKGKIGSATFKEAGTFTYFCEIHPTMHGTVEVVQ